MERENKGSKRSDEIRERMEVRTITLSDGRYMVFYTFGEGADASAEQGNEKEPDV